LDKVDGCPAGSGTVEKTTVVLGKDTDGDTVLDKDDQIVQRRQG